MRTDKEMAKLMVDCARERTREWFKDAVESLDRMARDMERHAKSFETSVRGEDTFARPSDHLNWALDRLRQADSIAWGHNGRCTLKDLAEREAVLDFLTSREEEDEG